MKEFWKKLKTNFNIEMFIGTMSMITAGIIAFTSMGTNSIPYAMNIILGFVMVGIGVLRLENKELNDKISNLETKLDSYRGV